LGVAEQLPEPGPARIRLVPPLDAGDTPLLYANFFQATVSQLDITLHLGWYTLPPFLEPPEEEEVQVPVRPLLKLSLPLSLVPGIITVLQAQLESWQQSFAATDSPNVPSAE
jgi:hypothetical protein